MDANSEFDHSLPAQEFLNQSMGSSATLFTIPTYPDPSTGLNVFLTPVHNTQLGLGVYDGAFPSGARTGHEGLQNFRSTSRKQFVIGEVDQFWNLQSETLPGKVGVGEWYSSNTFLKLDGGTESGTSGPYLMADQTLWSPAGSRPGTDGFSAIRAFIMYGYADPHIISFDQNSGGGLTWNGVFGRARDVVGIGVQDVRFGMAAQSRHTHERSTETFYKWEIRPWCYLKPDLQHISHPGGGDLEDALALTLRIELHL